MTKKQMINAFERYKKSNKRTLSDCYKNWSNDKQLAEYRALLKMSDCGGYDFRIISHNSSIFTCGFCYFDNESNNEKFVYITPYNEYCEFTDVLNSEN